MAGQACLETPANLGVRQLRQRSSGAFRYQLKVASSVEAEIDKTDLAKARGKLQRDALQSHRGPLRLRVAALLALLEQRGTVTEEDWRLAKMIMDVNDAVVAGVQKTRRKCSGTRRRLPPTAGLGRKSKQGSRRSSSTPRSWPLRFESERRPPADNLNSGPGAGGTSSTRSSTTPACRGGSTSSWPKDRGTTRRSFGPER